MDLIKEAYDNSIKALEACSTKHGFFASGGINGYNAVWARDSMITSLGASLINRFKETFKNSLINLAAHQSEKGQIPNAIDKYSERKPHVDFKSIDSTLWFLIGHFIYKSRHKSSDLFNKHKINIQKALLWLSYQDMGEDSMLEQLPTTDWQDAFPHKYGHAINTQALYYKVLTLANKKSEAKKLKQAVNNSPDDSLWNGNFYLPYRWKNHNKYQEKGDWFDSLGNLLAIIFDLADKEKTEKILAHVKKEKIALPYPIKAIYPPIEKGSKHWQDYFKDCDARSEYHYLNGGIWPFIGSFYVLALIKQKHFKEAEDELQKLAESNLKGNFPEWINPLTKEPHGSLQAWDAGTYILAYESLKQKKVLI